MSDMTTFTPQCIYFAIALVVSLFFGVCAPKMFQVKTATWDRFTWVHQFWLNFVGSMTGWICLWLISGRISAWLLATPPVDLGSWDMFIAFVAFIGITGYLPMASVQLIQNIGGWLGKLAEKVPPSKDGGSGNAPG